MLTRSEQRWRDVDRGRGKIPADGVGFWDSVSRRGFRGSGPTGKCSVVLFYHQRRMRFPSRVSAHSRMTGPRPRKSCRGSVPVEGSWPSPITNLAAFLGGESGLRHTQAATTTRGNVGIEPVGLSGVGASSVDSTAQSIFASPYSTPSAGRATSTAQVSRYRSVRDRRYQRWRT